MSRAKQSRNHHWWPVGLQSYWADKHGDVSWIEPDGKVTKRRVKNRKIGHKAHGHTFLKGNLWESNFESEFSIDGEVHTIINELKELKPLGRTPSEFVGVMKLLFKNDRTLSDMCKFYHLQEQSHRNLLLLIHSLLVRSPSNRHKYESYPGMFGLPPDEEVGKANMSQDYSVARKLCERGSISNQRFVLLHSPLKNFICGDGYLDWLTTGLTANRIMGRALIPLTPHICVYFCTPSSMRSMANCASFHAASWMVDRVNETTQIYSRDKLFFLGRSPKLSDSFRRQQFLEYKEKTVQFIAMLDEVAEI